MKKIIKIDGMSCNHCKLNVEKALKSIKGVSTANVSLFLKQVEVEYSDDVNEASLNQAIVDAGYQVKD